MGCTSTRATRAPGIRSATCARIVFDRGEQRRAVGDAEHHAADVALVRDLGREELDRNRIGKRQRRRRVMPASSATEGARAMPRRSSNAPAASSSSRGRGLPLGHPRGRPSAAARAAPTQRRSRRRRPRACGTSARPRGQRRQCLRRIRRQKSGERLSRAGTIDDRPHRHAPAVRARRADDREHQIEFRRGEQNVERRLHGLVARARKGEIDHPRGLDLDPGAGELRQCRRARRLDGHPAARQRIDHHGRAAAVVVTTPRACALAARRDRHPRSSGTPSIRPSSVSTRAMPQP